MAVDSIQCPSCGKRITLTKALTAEIEESLRKDIQRESREREKELRDEFEERLREEKKNALAKAKKDLGAELADTQDELADARKRLDTANKKELQLLRKQKELQDKQATLELEIERRVVAAQEAIMKKAGEQAAEKHRLKDQEKDKKITDFTRQVEELQRKLEQSSQQLQGEVAELDLETRLRQAFPHDDVEPVAKGTRGADIIWTIRTPQGADCGQVVWESKTAKAWSDTWLTKAKDDQRRRKAVCAVVVSVNLPDEVKHFGNMEGVWVCSPTVAVGVATALRAQIIQVASARLSADGKNSKMEDLYRYLTGAEFRQRVEALVESFVEMKGDLDRERRALELSWARREKQIGRAVQSLAGMYGDMQGIVGQTLQRVKTLELPSGEAILSPTQDSDDQKRTLRPSVS